MWLQVQFGFNFLMMQDLLKLHKGVYNFFINNFYGKKEQHYVALFTNWKPACFYIYYTAVFAYCSGQYFAPV